MFQLFSNMAAHLGKLTAEDLRLIAAYFDELKELLMRFGSLVSVAAVVALIVLHSVGELIRELMKLLGFKKN